MCLWRYQPDPNEIIEKEELKNQKWNPFRPPESPSAASSKGVSLLTILCSEFEFYYLFHGFSYALSCVLKCSFLALWNYTEIAACSKHCLLCFPVVVAIILCVTISQGIKANLIAEWWMILIITLVSLVLVVTAIIIWRQPQNKTKAAFMVSFCWRHRK